MKALITWREVGSRPAGTGLRVAPQGSFDILNVLEDTIRKILQGDLAAEKATVLLECVKLYKEVAISDRPCLPPSKAPETRQISLPVTLAVEASGVDAKPVDAVVQEVQSEVSGDVSGKLISAFVDEYLRYLQPTHAASYVRDVKSAFKWLMQNVGDKVMATIEPRTLEQLLAVEYGKASHNAARFYRTLKAAFNKAKIWGYIDHNPFENFRLPKIPETTAPHFNESDFERLLDQKITTDYKEFFAFGFYTGMRLSEITNIKWEAIDLADGKMTVTNYRGYHTKSKKERFIPLAPRLLVKLKERYSRLPENQRSGYVFQRRGKKYSLNYASRLLKSAVRKAGLEEKLHFHSLRHGFGTELIHKNVNPVHVKELMGHANLATTLRYVHSNEDDLRKAVNKLGPSEQDQL